MIVKWDIMELVCIARYFLNVNFKGHLISFESNNKHVVNVKVVQLPPCFTKIHQSNNGTTYARK